MPYTDCGGVFCGDAFCERCGDCLACYGGENCYDGGVDNGSHIWPVSVPGQNDTEGTG